MAITCRDIRILSDAADLDDYEERKRDEMNKDHMLTTDKHVMDMQRQKITELEAQLAEQNIRANQRVADALKDRADMVDRAVAAEARAEAYRGWLAGFEVEDLDSLATKSAEEARHSGRIAAGIHSLTIHRANRACEERSKAEADAARLLEECNHLKLALGFYANKENWKLCTCRTGIVLPVSFKTNGAEGWLIAEDALRPDEQPAELPLLCSHCHHEFPLGELLDGACPKCKTVIDWLRHEQPAESEGKK